MHQQLNQEEITEFWSFVDRREPDECWEWQGVRNQSGYGHYNSKMGTKVAHRISYELTNGPMPEGRMGCHRCNNPPCCNPNHIYPGTAHDNAVDLVRMGKSKNKDEEASKRMIVLRLDKMLAEELERLSIEKMMNKQDVLRYMIRYSLYDRMAKEKSNGCTAAEEVNRL